ncbi:MAG: monovalent cation/H(+) antiporter subunit G [Lysobacterales bacterium]
MTSWPLWLDLLVAGLLVLGAGYVLVAALALLRLPSFIQRLHGPTKAGTMGLGSVLLALGLVHLARGGLPLREALLLGFLFWTAPLAAQQLAQAWMRRHPPIDPREAGPAEGKRPAGGSPHS